MKLLSLVDLRALGQPVCPPPASTLARWYFYPLVLLLTSLRLYLFRRVAGNFWKRDIEYREMREPHSSMKGNFYMIDLFDSNKTNKRRISIEWVKMVKTVKNRYTEVNTTYLKKVSVNSLQGIWNKTSKYLLTTWL